MRIRLRLLLVTALLLSGCTETVYEIELTPSGDSMRRQLVVHRKTTGEERRSVLAAEELADIAQAYGADVGTPQADRHVFVGDFAQWMPEDVGGSGWHFALRSPLGATRCFVERFRGSDDLGAGLERRLAASDRLMELIAEFVRAEAGDDPCCRRLQTFVEGPLQRDVRNLVLFVWAGQIVEHYEVNSFAEFSVRIAQYLVEREYFAPADIPELLKAAAKAEQKAEQSDYVPLLKCLQRALARKIGVPRGESVPECVAQLLDEEHLRTAFPKFLEESREYRQLIARREEQSSRPPESARPDSIAVLEQLVSEAVWSGGALFQSSDSLSVTLQLASQPILTNGEWDSDTSAVCWTRRLSTRPNPQPDWPSLVYAIWSEPNVDYQTQHLGRTLLDGDGLRDFCIWYATLSPEEAEHWDQFVSGLRPGKELADQIRQFHFPDESPAAAASSPSESRADAAKSLLLEALKDES